MFLINIITMQHLIIFNVVFKCKKLKQSKKINHNHRLKTVNSRGQVIIMD